MGSAIKSLFLLPGLIVGLGLMPAGRVTAQTFTTLHSFTYSDGADPYAGLILSGNTLYGTAPYGGSAGYGAVFKVNSDGTGFTNLYSFAGFTNGGAYPYAGLILSGNTLYGAAESGGNSGYGMVFKINTDGTSFTNLYIFTGGSDGGNPYGGLILLGDTLYGTASAAGNGFYGGTVYKVSTNGTGFTALHSF